MGVVTYYYLPSNYNKRNSKSRLGTYRTMRTLYIFGDSFTVDYETDWTWTRQLASKLRVDAMLNDSIIGCSNEWILTKVKENQDKITKDDVVASSERPLSLFKFCEVEDEPVNGFVL